MARPSFQVPAVIEFLRRFAPAAQLSADSRRIAAGDVFFAFPGDGADGRDFIADAVHKGAAAIVYEAENFDWNDNWNLPHLPVPDLKQHAGLVANRFYRQPDGAMFVAAVTGTNGKTSCSQWLAAAFSSQGRAAAAIGTLGTGIFRQGQCRQFEPTGYTTPDALQLQRTLAEMRNAGAAALAIEASSIGLDQGRMNGMHVDAALFTNLSRDHLDYHGNMAAYENAKNILFDWPGLQHAIVNLDDPMGRRLARRLAQRSPAPAVTGYTVAGNRHEGIPVLGASEIRSHASGTSFRLDSQFGSAQMDTALLGTFNISNALGVLGVLLAQGVQWDAALPMLESLQPVPGRMQQIGGDEAPLIVIDYAHTPDALAKALAALRPVAQQRGGRIWCVFGCGGDRDPGKRAQMGAVSRAADHVVLTSDNPRSEQPMAIITQILTGMRTATVDTAAGLQPQVIEDRAAAILWAIKHAARRDVILLAGKGHEAFQEVDGKKMPFLDAEHARLALVARATMRGAV